MQSLIKIFLAAVKVTNAVSSPEWYLPGVSPVQYQQGQKVPLYVNKLTSVKTQLPYRYYTLAYCPPDKIHESRGNLGSSLLGDVVENSPFEIHMLENKDCKTLCTRELSPADKKTLSINDRRGLPG